MDEIGGVDFVLPAIDEKTAIVGAGKRYKIYHETYGLLGTYIHKGSSVQVSDGRPAITVQADDALIEMVHKNCYFRRNFNYVQVDSVVSSLVALVSGWSTGTLETSIGNTTVSYEGESVFEALDVLRDRWGRHFRLGGDQVVDFGSFGTDSGIRLIRPESVPRELADNDDVAFVANLEIIEESAEIINRLIPVGAGAGTAQLTLEHTTSTEAAYPVSSGLNADGSSFYYIEDATSQAAYGLVERPLERSNIRPLTNGTVNLQNAANTLYRAALTMLLRWKDPRTYYKVSVSKLAVTGLEPGDKIRLVYRGIADYQGLPYKWVDVDTLMWVMDITETYGANGQQRVTLEVAATDDRRTQDKDILSRLMTNTRVNRVHVQPGPTHSPVNGEERIDSTHTAAFEVRLLDEVLSVNRVLLRFRTLPLRSDVASVAGASTTTPSGGGSTTPSGGGSTTPSGGGSTTPSGGGSTTPSGGGSTTPAGQGSSSPGGGSGTIPSSSGGHSNFTEVEDGSVAGLDPVYLVHGGFFSTLRADSGSGDTFVQTETDGGKHGHTTPDHTHNVPSHQHTTPSHQHNTPDHQHTTPAHQHTTPAHQHTTPNHQHTLVPEIATTYGLFEDSVYPQVISISINGTDRTTALGGTWAPTNAAVEEELDITEYILQGQVNTVVFSCTTGQGRIVFLADQLLTIQAIAVT
ncbi:MAG: hypothetical protein GY805_05045 [Chloroflexi bacterium]|nr:hypothetical protein [Chloroflexota bacterium]